MKKFLTISSILVCCSSSAAWAFTKTDIYNIGLNLGQAEYIASKCNGLTVSSRALERFMIVKSRYPAIWQRGYDDGYKIDEVAAEKAARAQNMTTENFICRSGAQLYGPHGSIAENVLVLHMKK
ncbi:MAG: hypothetical protein DSY80_00535 [Desulfocapsa sp.]|nr:MAG: hypothetical protein DSY80_00535 [Desulfocapsa sp.]